ncbi:cytochrome c-type biogenesis protein CcsB [Mumia flava]|uniref:Cytochrome c-type biogenesis protein CcsB n=1 Tax=Mumia flava TaxID=1348852 RepID=A0A0B2BUK4_9ACTN|nr:c-type cytochrome biogenesis protein CcsB [Mumia flava]PJJ58183.1 cytochrome c-type biogenesis protein CcsB [Mumia flava]
MTLTEYANFSNYAVASATVVLALAWLASVAQWAFGSVASRSGESVGAAERTPVMASSGGAYDGVSGGGSPTADDDSARGGVAEERSEVAGRIAIALTILGFLILLAGVVARGLAAERVPWGNMYEFAITSMVVVLAGYLVMIRLMHIQWLAPLVLAFVTVVLGLSMTVYVPAGPLVPALDSYWLVIHVASAMVAGAGFLVGAGASILYLIKARAEARGPVSGYLGRLPSAAAMDQLAYRVTAFAFPVWTFAALISGPIWAEHAWGRPWGWDPKEVWAFITWVAYAGYLHARATAGWKGKAAAILALVAFATFIFNFVGVNLFFPGLHSYAK